MWAQLPQAAGEPSTQTIATHNFCPTYVTITNMKLAICMGREPGASMSLAAYMSPKAVPGLPTVFLARLMGAFPAMLGGKAQNPLSWRSP